VRPRPVVPIPNPTVVLTGSAGFRSSEQVRASSRCAQSPRRVNKVRKASCALSAQLSVIAPPCGVECADIRTLTPPPRRCVLHSPGPHTARTRERDGRSVPGHDPRDGAGQAQARRSPPPPPLQLPRYPLPRQMPHDDHRARMRMLPGERLKFVQHVTGSGTQVRFRCHGSPPRKPSASIPLSPPAGNDTRQEHGQQRPQSR